MCLTSLLASRGKRWLCNSSALLGALLSGCAAWTGAQPLQPVGDIATLEQRTSLPAQSGPWPRDAWIEQLGDPQLTALASEALADNPGLAIAQARVRASQALLAAAHGPLEPVAGIAGAGGRSNLSQDLGLPTPVGPTPPTSAWSNSGQLLASAAYELDLWGKNRAALAAASSELQAAQADAQQARLSLLAVLAATYNEFAREQAALDLLRQLAAKREFALRLTQSLVDNGLSSEPDLIKARDDHKESQLQLAQLDEQLALRRHQIAALLGKGPDRGLKLSAPRLSTLAPPKLPSSLPAELLGRRPDIVAARWRVEAAARQVDVAVARFYPNINLSAFAGYATLGIVSGGGSTVQGFGVGPAISLPLFDGGLLRANVKGQQAQYEAARALYQQTLIAALSEVADNVSAQQALQRQLTINRQAQQDAVRRTVLARQAYRAGLVSELTLIQADSAELAQRLKDIDLAAHGRELQIGLFKALGGGYQAPALPQPRSATTSAPASRRQN